MTLKPTYIHISYPSIVQLAASLQAIISKINSHNTIIASFIQDSINTGLRFQELYSFLYVIGEDENSLTFKTEKGSNDRQLNKALFSDYYLNSRLAGEVVYFKTGLSNFYTVFNRFSFPYKFYHGQKELAAHVCRHLFAKLLFEECQNREQVRQLLGEKSILNSNNYIDSQIEIKQIYF